MGRKILFLIFAAVSLVIVLAYQDEIRQLLSLAAPKGANIVIDTRNPGRPIVNSWSSFAQGGEEPPPMLSSVVDKLSTLKPRYIRLDHIYDSYDLVKKDGQKYVYDFTKLDQTVNDIIRAGAIPFFSLSYMPPAFTSSGSVIDAPGDWNNWKDLIKATIEHFSGKNMRNLQGVYYEVWNEPELPQFGSWKLAGGKDYRLLYYYAQDGAKEAQNTNSFQFGGPGVGSYYPHWIRGLVSYVSQNNLRLDFYSWHRYSKKADIFASDARETRKILTGIPNFGSLPIILSEWGIESENTSINNSAAASSFIVSAVSSFHPDINMAFNFEVKDGPPPNGGKWGLFTHEKDPQNPAASKPRSKIFAELSKMEGKSLPVGGQGTYVSAMASSLRDNINVILANYDPNGRNHENVPVTFTGLSPSSYMLKYSYPLENISGSYELVTTNGTLNKNFIMTPNSVLLLELSTNARLADFIPGANGGPLDQALFLPNTDNSLIFSYPELHLEPVGSVSFDLKPMWDMNSKDTFFIFELPFSVESGTINKLFMTKEASASGSRISFGMAEVAEEFKVSSPINWVQNSWHHIQAGWDQTGLYLTIDGNKNGIDVPLLDIRNGRRLKFYSIDAAIDNLQFVSDQSITLTRHFDGRIDR